MFDYDTYSKIYVKDKKPMHAANKYHSLLCVGLAKCGVKVNSFSALPISRINCDRIFVRVPAIKEGNLLREYISLWNVPVLRHLGLFFSSFFKMFFSKKDTVLIYDALVVSAAFGAVLGSKFRGIKSVCVLTDLPDYQQIANMGSLYKLNKKLIDMADSYVYLTKQMNDSVNKKNKPFLIIEGLVDSEMGKFEHAKSNNSKRIVMYAGSLRVIYGIKHLCESFLKSTTGNEELHVYGDGEYANDLVEISNNHENVIFHGNCVNSEVVQCELISSLLVNPRPSEGEYTKYSFPSKTLEYMVSGTPVLSSKLAGIPDEYDEYLYYFDDSDPDGLYKAMSKLFSQSDSELQIKGNSARQFVLKNKNNIVQAEKLISFIENEVLK